MIKYMDMDSKDNKYAHVPVSSVMDAIRSLLSETDRKFYDKHMLCRDVANYFDIPYCECRHISYFTADSVNIFVDRGYFGIDEFNKLVGVK